MYLRKVEQGQPCTNIALLEIEAQAAQKQQDSPQTLSTAKKISKVHSNRTTFGFPKNVVCNQL